MTRAAQIVGRYETHEYRVEIAGRVFRLLGPRFPHTLNYDPRVQARWEQDGYKPFWAQPWPAAVMLAEHVIEQVPLGSTPLLELGAGLGLAGLALLQAGYRVVMTDYEPDALEFIGASARLNGMEPPEVHVLDWREPAQAHYATIIASDVLYCRKDHAPLVSFLKTCLGSGGRAFISDVNREEAEPFPALLAALDWSCTFTAAQAHAIPGCDARDGRVFAGRVFSITKP